MNYFKEEINYKDASWFKRTCIIESRKWASLVAAAKSVYPVLLHYANYGIEAKPGQERIAALCGKAIKTVRKGIKGLEEGKLIIVRRVPTRAGQHRCEYFLLGEVGSAGDVLPFHRAIIESGIWSQLTSTAHAVYMVMRHFSFPESGYIVNPTPEEKEKYKKRTYEHLYAERKRILEYAGVKDRALTDAIRLLSQNGLIKDVCCAEGHISCKIMLIPEDRYDHNDLNAGVKKPQLLLNAENRQPLSPF